MAALTPEMLLDYADPVRFGLMSALLLFARGWFVRLVVALLAGVELGHALLTGGDRMTIIWMAVLIGVAVAIQAGSLVFGSAARLSAEEQAMNRHLFGGVGRARARHFFDQGYWLNGNPGEVLQREGEVAGQFCYLSAGEAKVLMGGRTIGFCRDADVIGGMGALGGEPAAATVMLNGPARFWCAPAERLRAYLAAHPDLRRRVERAIGEGAAVREDAAAAMSHGAAPTA